MKPVSYLIARPQFGIVRWGCVDVSVLVVSTASASFPTEKRDVIMTKSSLLDEMIEYHRLQATA